MRLMTVIHTQGGIYPGNREACTHREACTRVYTTAYTQGGMYPGIYRCYTHTGRHVPRVYTVVYTHREACIQHIHHCYTHPGRL